MGKQNVGPVQIAIAAVVAVLLLGGLAWLFLGRKNTGPNVKEKMGPGYRGPGGYGTAKGPLIGGGPPTAQGGPPTAPPSSP